MCYFLTMQINQGVQNFIDDALCIWLRDFLLDILHVFVEVPFTAVLENCTHLWRVRLINKKFIAFGDIWMVQLLSDLNLHLHSLQCVLLSFENLHCKFFICSYLCALVNDSESTWSQFLTYWITRSHHLTYFISFYGLTVILHWILL